MSVCEFLDALSSTVRQQAETIRLSRAAAPRNVFAGRLRPSRSAVAGGAYQSQMTIAQANTQYKHFRGNVYSAIRVIANRIAAQPITVARRLQGSGKSLSDSVRLGDIDAKSIPHWAVKQIDYDKFELLESHELIATLEEPNTLMVRHTMMEFLVYNLFITGVSFLMVSQSERRGRKYDLLPLPTTWVQPVWNRGSIAGWNVKPPSDDGDPIPVSPQYMLRFFLPDPSNPASAISPENMLAHAILNAESIAEAQHANFRNEGAPAVALIAGEDADMVLSGGRGSGLATLTPEQRQEIRDWFRQEYATVARTGMPLVCDNIIRDIKILARTPKDMAFIESAAVTKEQIFEGFGVPAVSAGQVRDAPRDVAATADGTLCKNAINPTIRMMSQVLRRGLAPLFGRDLTLWIEEVAPDDPELNQRDWEIGVRGFYVSINDGRRKLGLKPIDGADVFVIPQRARLVTFVDGKPIEILGVGDATSAKETTADESPGR